MGGGLGDALVDTMAAAIVKMEGVNPNFAPNNNPGNLVYAGQVGAVPGAGGFAAFPTYAAGYSALQSQVQGQINKGQDLTDFFNQYAPPNTKNAAGGVQTSAATQSYIDFVSQQTGIDPSVPLNSIQADYLGAGSTPSPSPSTFDSSTPDDSSPDSDSSTIFGIDSTSLMLIAAVGIGIVLISDIL